MKNALAVRSTNGEGAAAPYLEEGLTGAARADMAVARATADEILMRLAPALVHGPAREAAAFVVAKDRADLIEVLELLASGFNGHSEINVHTGALFVMVDPEFFPKFKRVATRYLDLEVMGELRSAECGVRTGEPPGAIEKRKGAAA